MSSYDLVYVASSNGLGHARRGALICQELAKKNMSVTLIANSRKFDLLRSEFPKSTRKFEMLPFDYSLGIDGPWATRKIQKPTRAETAEVLRRISGAKITLGDNVVWPARFAPRFSIFGHFLWVDVLPLNEMGDDAAIRKEIEDLEAIESWISFAEFRQESNFCRNVRRVDVPFFSISNKLVSLRPNSYWISIGKTGQYDSTSLIPQVAGTFQHSRFVVRDSYLLKEHSVGPEACLARPGLGTIRDCIDSNIPIVFFGARDVSSELRHNEINAVRLGVGIALESLRLPEDMQRFKLAEIREFQSSFKANNFLPIGLFTSHLSEKLGI